jgi:hypothetical protein
MRFSPDTLYIVANSVAFIGWLFLLASPWIPRVADMIAGIAIPLLLAVAYAVLMFFFVDLSAGGFDTLANLMKLFGRPEAVLVGWLHYLAFDLFIGSWQVETARREGIPFAWIIPALVLTLFLGPIGLLTFMAIRLIGRGRIPPVTA